MGCVEIDEADGLAALNDYVVRGKIAVAYQFMRLSGRQSPALRLPVLLQEALRGLVKAP